MKRKTFLSQVLSLMLVFVLVLGSIPPAQLPVYALEETGSEDMPYVMGEVIAYEELAPEISVQKVPLGTDRSALNLPEMLTAKVSLPLDVTSAVYGSDTSMDISVPVVWTSSPAYDGYNAGDYTFTAAAEGYTANTEPPVITVTVGEAAEGMITAFAELPEDIRWQNTMAPEFPETVEGTIDGKTIQISVTWEADHDYDAEYPERGLYVFTAVLGEGYEAEDDVELPRLTVYIPQTVGIMMMRMAGSGTTDSPLEITTAAQLAEIATLVNSGKLESFLFNSAPNVKASFKLMNDIDLSAYSKGEGWIPIGKYVDGANDKPFSGHFDGNGHVISGLYINRNGAGNQGLFGYIDGATVENLGVTDVNITGDANVGGVVGYSENGTIQNCYSTGSVGGNTSVGGVAGHVNNGTVQNCYSTGSVSCNAILSAGGVVGVAFGTVRNCYSTGIVSGVYNVGGVVGYVGLNGNVQNCVAMNFSLEGTSGIGRIAGVIDTNVTLSSNYAFSGIPGSWSTDNEHDKKNGADVPKVNLADSSFWTSSANWNGSEWNSTIWTFADNKLPIIRNLGGQDDTLPVHISGSYFEGEGSEAEPYLIKTAADLAKLAELVNAGISDYSIKHYRLENNIDLSDYSDGEGWISIGKRENLSDNSKAFKGNFNGNGFVITGLCINRNADYQGLFGYINGGTVKNLGVTDVDIFGQKYVGSVAGTMNGSTLENCHSSGSVNSSSSYTGGFVGYMEESNIKNCYSTTNVEGKDRVGGVAGYIYRSTMENCYSTGSVEGTEKVGGLIGRAHINSKVQNCAALNSSVTGTGVVGRVVGENEASILSNNYAFSDITGTWKNIGNGKIDGVDVTKEDLANSGFWTTAGNWNGAAWNSTLWDIVNNKLPILKGIDGQNNALPAHITGQDFDGLGSEDNPYLIKTAEDLAKLAELVNAGTSPYADAGKYYQLENDIDLSAYSSGEGWTPVGKTGKPFRGHFDGNNKIITGLCINRSNASSLGLFGVIDGGTVENLGVTNAAIIGYDFIGGVVGYVSNGTIQNCYSAVSVSNNYYAGGVAGYVSNATIQNCYSTGSISRNGNEYTGWHLGGVVGKVESSSTVKNCYSTGSVSGYDSIGGVAGSILNSTVENCYSTGSINCNGGGAGGVVGYMEGGTVKNNLALNSLVYATDSVGRVVGYVLIGTLSKNYAFSDITGSWKNIGNEKKDGVEVTKEVLANSGFWTTGGNWAANIAWDSNIWTFADNKMPILNNLEGQDDTPPFHIGGFDGKGTITKPYLIKTAADLAKLAELVNAGTSPYADVYNYYKLENNIDLSAYTSDGGWMPIGSSSKPFEGNFNGNGHVISGLYINRNADYQGLFGYISNGNVQNVGLTDIDIKGRVYTGGVVGYIAMGTVKNCYSSGSVEGTNQVGGIAGHGDSTIQYCYSSGSVDGNTYVGGLVGYKMGGKIDNCYSTDSVNGNQNVGGLAGYVYSRWVDNSYSTGSVKGNQNVGGVVGYLHNVGSRVQNCAALNSSVSGTTEVGRVVGLVDGTLSYNYAFSRVPGTWSIDKEHNKRNGADITASALFTPVFWTTAENWNGSAWDSSIWTFAADKLPVLMSLTGQNGDGGLYLSIRDIQYATVTLSNDSLTYNGVVQYPNVTVGFDGETLQKDVDYVVTITSTDGSGTSAGINVGTATVSITGKGNYTGNVNRTFTIVPAELTITDGTVTAKTYDGTLSADITGVTFDGLQNSENLVLGTDYTVTGLEFDDANAGDDKTVTGTVALRSTLKTANYLLPDCSLSLTGQTIAKAALTITGGTATAKTYDGTLSADITGVTFDGLQNSETLVLGTDYIVTGAEFDDASAGDDKTVTGTMTLLNSDTAKNYSLADGSVSIVNQIITKRPITVKAEDKSMTAGGTLPTFTFTVEGQLQGETALVGTPVISSPSVNTNAAGTYAITVDLAGVSYTANYTAAAPAYINGTLTVTASSSGGGNNGSGSSGGGSSDRDRDGRDSSDDNRTSTPAPSNSTTTDASTDPPVGITISNGGSVSNTEIQEIASDGKVLVVESEEGAKLVFYTDALKGISSQALSEIKVEIKDVSTAHRESIPDKIVFSLTVSSDRGTISNFGGKVTVSLPYELKEGERVEDVTVWHLADDGTMVEIPCTYDPVTKLATFTVTHFSLYVVGVADGKTWVNTFTDVAVSDWFCSAVEYVNRNGLFMGTGADTFSPNSSMTRAMLWTVLGRLDGQNLSGSDVFDAARNWAIGEGITDGDNPEASITREQMVPILWRYAGSPKADGGLNSFSDGDSVAGYAAEAMAWAVENGMLVGSNGALMPQDKTTRAQVAAILQRFAEKGKN